jgi:hypothetical protein
MFRWAREGARGPGGQKVFLEAVRLGSRWLTSVEAIRRFAAALTPPLAGKAPKLRTARRRCQAADKAGKKLQAMGI